MLSLLIKWYLCEWGRKKLFIISLLTTKILSLWFLERERDLIKPFKDVLKVSGWLRLDTSLKI